MSRRRILIATAFVLSVSIVLVVIQTLNTFSKIRDQHRQTHHVHPQLRGAAHNSNANDVRIILKDTTVEIITPAPYSSSENNFLPSTCQQRASASSAAFLRMPAKRRRVSSNNNDDAEWFEDLFGVFQPRYQESPFHPNFPRGAAMPNMSATLHQQEEISNDDDNQHRNLKPKRAQKRFTPRQQEVVETFIDAWRPYVTVLGHDELIIPAAALVVSAVKNNRANNQFHNNVDNNNKNNAGGQQQDNTPNGEEQQQEQQKQEEEDDDERDVPKEVERFRDWGVSPQKRRRNRNVLSCAFGIGATAIEALDTMLLMGLRCEAGRVIRLLESKQHHTFRKDVDVSLFETTIRVLGGLLSSYELTGLPILLTKAHDLGTRLMSAFTKSESAIPFSTVNLLTGNAFNKYAEDEKTRPRTVVSLAEVTSIQMEFTKLSYWTGDASFAAAANRAYRMILKHVKQRGSKEYSEKKKRRNNDKAAFREEDGGQSSPAPDVDGMLMPPFVRMSDGRPYDTRIFEHDGTCCRTWFATTGAHGDSFYENVVKMFRLTEHATSSQQSFLSLLPAVVTSRHDSDGDGGDDNEDETAAFTLWQLWRGLRRDIRDKMLVQANKTHAYLSEWQLDVSASVDLKVDDHPARRHRMDHLSCFAPGMFLLGLHEQEEDDSPAADGGASVTMMTTDGGNKRNIKKKDQQDKNDNDNDGAAQQRRIDEEQRRYQRQKEDARDLKTAEDITRMCHFMYASSQASGLGAEAVHFVHHDQDVGAENKNANPVDDPINAAPDDIMLQLLNGHNVNAEREKRNRDRHKLRLGETAILNSRNGRTMVVKDGPDAKHIGRPEALEAHFYLWRYTRQPHWQDSGFDIFRAMKRNMVLHVNNNNNNGHDEDAVKHQFDGAAVGVSDVRVKQSALIGKTESFFFSETLKYAFLLFDDSTSSADDLVPLTSFVFTTEGHALRKL